MYIFLFIVNNRCVLKKILFVFSKSFTRRKIGAQKIFEYITKLRYNIRMEFGNSPAQSIIYYVNLFPFVSVL